jgi:spermidine synthase
MAGWWDPADYENEELVRRIVVGSHCFLVVKEGDKIVGMGRAISDKVNDAYLQDITVFADLRHQGVGTGIVERLVDRLRHDGLKWIGLIAGGNSHPFYRRLGFAPMPFSTPMLLQE